MSKIECHWCGQDLTPEEVSTVDLRGDGSENDGNAWGYCQTCGDNSSEVLAQARKLVANASERCCPAYDNGHCEYHNVDPAPPAEADELSAGDLKQLDAYAVGQTAGILIGEQRATAKIVAWLHAMAREHQSAPEYSYRGMQGSIRAALGGAANGIAAGHHIDAQHSDE